MVYTRLVGARAAAAIALGIAVAFATGSPARAAPAVTITVDPDDRNVTITSFAGAAKPLTASVRLSAARRVKSFRFIASDLVQQGGDARVPRSNVRLKGKKALRPRFPRDFKLTVRGVPMPGTYKGKGTVLAPGGRRSQFTVTVVVKPLAVSPAVEAMHVRVAHCPIFKLSCRPFRFLVPGRWFDDDRRVALLTTSPAPVTVAGVDTLVVDADGDRLGTNILNVDEEFGSSGKKLWPRGFGASRVVEIPLT
jgi:hypothetical protein